MKTALTAVLDEFYEFTLPNPVPRQAEFPLIPRKATVIIGMRRTGKTWFCYQKMQELLREGIPLNRILYLNFDDDRLFGFTVSDFQSILDVYPQPGPSRARTLEAGKRWARLAHGKA